MIRPIHMQMILPQTENAGVERHFENQKIVNTNADAANEVMKEVKHNSETVIKKDANEFAEYQYDAKEEGNGTYQNPRKKKKQHKEEEHLAGEAESEQGEAEYPRINIQI